MTGRWYCTYMCLDMWRHSYVMALGMLRHCYITVLSAMTCWGTMRHDVALGMLRHCDWHLCSVCDDLLRHNAARRGTLHFKTLDIKCPNMSLLHYCSVCDDLLRHTAVLLDTRLPWHSACCINMLSRTEEWYISAWTCGVPHCAACLNMSSRTEEWCISALTCLWWHYTGKNENTFKCHLSECHLDEISDTTHEQKKTQISAICHHQQNIDISAP